MRPAPLAYILSGCGFEAGLIVKVAERIVSGCVGPMQDLTQPGRVVFHLHAYHDVPSG